MCAPAHVQIRRVGEIHRRVKPTHVVRKVVRHLRAVIGPGVVRRCERLQLSLDGRDAVKTRLGNNYGLACILRVFPDRVNRHQGIPSTGACRKRGRDRHVPRAHAASRSRCQRCRARGVCPHAISTFQANPSRNGPLRGLCPSAGL
jgi:hypothetical protein